MIPRFNDKNVLKTCLSAHFLGANMENCHIVANVVVNLITSIILKPITIQLLDKTVEKKSNLLYNKDFRWNNETLKLITWQEEKVGANDWERKVRGFDSWAKQYSGS